MVGTQSPQVFNSEKQGAAQGTLLTSAPARGPPAHPRLRPSPAPGTRALVRGDGAGEARGSPGPRQPGARSGGGDSDLRPRLGPCLESQGPGRRETSRWGEGEGNTCGKAKTQRPWIQSLSLQSLPFPFSRAPRWRSRDPSGSWGSPLASLCLCHAFRLLFLPPPPLLAFLPVPVPGHWRWQPACNPSWSWRQGRAPPSAGKLCTFPRLPFV